MLLVDQNDVEFCVVYLNDAEGSSQGWEATYNRTK